MAPIYKIHPAIGIARVGNSAEVFLGSKIPGTYARPDDGKYRDANKNLRRQGCQFCVFEYTDESEPRLVTAGQGSVARIEWTVHLVNKKAAWFDFDGLMGEGIAGYPAGHPLRNAHITDPVERKSKLVIDPGPRTLTALLDSIEASKGTGGGYSETWPGPLTGGIEITSLGTFSTDSQGFLTVAGGYGKSGTTGPLPADGKLKYDDNDHWFDDVSDGSVTARLVFADGTSRVVEMPSWIIVGPPDYAPPIENLVTIYDLLYDLGLRHFGSDPSIFNTASGKFEPAFTPSFTDHVYPILRRTVDYRWVIQQAMSHTAATFNFAALAAPPVPGEDPTTTVRWAVFDRVRDPDLIEDSENPQRNMPRLHNDGTGGVPPETFKFTVSRFQYEVLRRWANGQFIPDWSGLPVPGSAITPQGLDRAALEAACGGSFFPGMEASWNLRDPRVYLSPFEFRFRHAASEGDPTGVTPGDVTRRSALPWQADFLKCANNWWPAQRPNQVRLGPTSGTTVQWQRGITSHVDLVNRWWKLGIVVQAADPGSVSAYHESEREL
jgi:hypothetical protein